MTPRDAAPHTRFQIPTNVKTARPHKNTLAQSWKPPTPSQNRPIKTSSTTRTVPTASIGAETSVTDAGGLGVVRYKENDFM
jgi:hypothetical protein